LKKASVILLIAAIILSVFSGCSFRFRQIDTLMRPPLAQGDYNKLQTAFYKSAGRDVILKSPKSGSYRSAFVLYDIDNDNEEEALAFYIRNDDKTIVHMHVLNKTSNQWNSAGDFIGSGSEIIQVLFVNMNKDSLPEIIVSWSIKENINNSFLTIYNCTVTNENLSVKTVSNEMFTRMEPLDIDNDSEIEIFIVLLDKAAEAPQAFAKSFKMLDNGQTLLTSQTQLDGNIVDYGLIKTEKKSDEFPMRIYIDANKGETQMITEMVYWDSGKSSLVSPLFNTVTQSNVLTMRSVRIPSSDINQDGYIEIPTQELLPGAKVLQTENPEYGRLYLTKWIQIQHDSSAVEKLNTLINYIDEYMLIIPNNLLGKISVLDYEKDNRWDICLYESSSDSYGELLFSITSVKRQEWATNSSKYSDYFEILSGASYIVAAKITNTGIAAGINSADLKQNITAFIGE
jgi:hypothetical protein